MIITLCGSAKFDEEFIKQNERLTLAGHVVFSLAVLPRDKKGKKSWYDERQKTVLDHVHKLKIDASDAILVLNVGGYIGESTASEIAHAKSKRKKVFYLVPPNPNDIGMAAYSRGKAICFYDGCYDPLLNRPPCALCYE